MKESHKWLSSYEDIPFAAMLAVSDMNTDALLSDAEECFTLLKKRFPSNASQSLSHVLSLSNLSPEIKCTKIIEIFNGLKAARHSYGSNYELAALGTLADTDVTAAQLVEDIAQVDDYLKKQKGFGSLSIGSYSRRMYAALIVMNSYKTNCSAAEYSALGSTLALAISMEIYMIIIMTM